MAGTAKRRGSIQKRDVNTWRITYDAPRGDDGRRVRRTFTYKGAFTDAQKALTKVLKDKDDGIDVNPNKQTVEQLLTRWLALHDVQPQSKARYAQLIRLHIVPHLGALRLQGLKPLRVQECIASVGADASASTARDVHLILKMAFKWAVGMQELVMNPANDCKGPKVEDTDVMRVLVPDEIQRLIAAAEGTPFGPLIDLSLATGIRRGEALALKWRTVDLTEGTVSIEANARFEAGTGVVYGTPKTKKSRRTVALSAATVSMLKAHRKQQNERRLKWGQAWGNTEGLVFTDEIGRPIPIGSFNAKFNKFVAKAGITGRVRAHDLRHTHATILAVAGINAAVISDRLGHEKVAFTLDRYVNPAQDAQRAAAEAFSAVLKQA